MSSKGEFKIKEFVDALEYIINLRASPRKIARRVQAILEANQWKWLESKRKVFIPFIIEVDPTNKGSVKLFCDYCLPNGVKASEFIKNQLLRSFETFE